MTHDLTIGITNTEHCAHGMHFVRPEQITWIFPKTGGRRRICEDCKAKVEKRNKEMRRENA